MLTQAGRRPAPSTCAEAGLAVPSLSSFRCDDIPAPPPPPCVVPVIWDQDAPKPDHGLALTLMSLPWLYAEREAGS